MKKMLGLTSTLICGGMHNPRRNKRISGGPPIPIPIEKNLYYEGFERAPADSHFHPQWEFFFSVPQKPSSNPSKTRETSLPKYTRPHHNCHLLPLPPRSLCLDASIVATAGAPLEVRVLAAQDPTVVPSFACVME